MNYDIKELQSERYYSKLTQTPYMKPLHMLILAIITILGAAVTLLGAHMLYAAIWPYVASYVIVAGLVVLTIAIVLSVVWTK